MLNLDEIDALSKSEDLIICHYCYDWFKEKNIKFAPLEVASRFSFEQPIDEYPSLSWQKTFGFHGKPSLHQILVEISHNKNFSVYNSISFLKLTDISYIIFPDWKINTKNLAKELYNLICKLSQNQQFISEKLNTENVIITLVVDITEIQEEEANLIFSDIAINLKKNENLYLHNFLNLTFIQNFTDQQWTDLLPNITAKISLAHENQEVLEKLISNSNDNIVCINLNSENYVILPDWQIDHELIANELVEIIEKLHIHEEVKQGQLLINTIGLNTKEATEILLDIAMYLSFNQGINLGDRWSISLFDELTDIQWYSFCQFLNGYIPLQNANQLLIAKCDESHVPKIIFS
jgi:hypothetical protein